MVPSLDASCSKGIPCARGERRVDNSGSRSFLCPEYEWLYNYCHLWHRPMTTVLKTCRIVNLVVCNIGCWTQGMFLVVKMKLILKWVVYLIWKFCWNLLLWFLLYSRRTPCLVRPSSPNLIILLQVHHRQLTPSHSRVLPRAEKHILVIIRYVQDMSSFK